MADEHAHTHTARFPASSPDVMYRRSSLVGPVIVIYAIVAVLAIGLLMVGLGLTSLPSRADLAVGGFIGLFLVLTMGPIGILIAAGQSVRQDARVYDALDDLLDAVRHLADQAALTDDARRVLNRRAERDMLRRAIEEDIDAGDWSAGLVLCHELAERFGYRADAEEFRARIDVARRASLDTEIADGIARLDGLILQKRWDDAQREAARLVRTNPDSSKVIGLPERVVNARSAYKSDLERRFLDASRDDRIEEAMGLLKELDAYLSPEDAAPYQEMARGVIGKARENLGAQFKIAVHDRDWPTAAAVGRRIINEFPNTRMASEVRRLLDAIISNANAPTSA
ncbi:MAG: hypothetical protein JNM07_06265 [Phycisphaerae bacterium]|nr:hypothetical protein [Phycisphaerae bacterium]